MGAPSRLRILVVGCGLGGLTCAVQCLRNGCQVLILEKAPVILPIGAGIMVPPNAMRVLGHLNLLDSFMPKGTVELESVNFRSYDDGEVLHCRRGGKTMRTDFGAPWCTIHRAEYHETLYEEFIRLGGEIRLGCDVQTFAFDEPSVTTADGEVIQGDVIVGADGLWSTARDQLLGIPTPPRPTGDVAYRMTLDDETLSIVEEPAVIELLRPNAATVWLGPDRHCVFYPIRARKEWNLVLMRPDNMPQGVKTQEVVLEEMKASFEGWDPRLQRLMSQAKSVLSWKLLHCEELSTWVKGRVVLLGDACHPSLPYQAQGAAMALEDGLTLGTLLGFISRSPELPIERKRECIPELIQLYETLRKKRTSTNQKGALSNRSWYHAREGPEMTHRNRVFKDADGYGPCEWKGADFAYQKELLGFDAAQVVSEALKVWQPRGLGTHENGTANGH